MITTWVTGQQECDSHAAFEGIDYRTGSRMLKKRLHHVPIHENQPQVRWHIPPTPQILAYHKKPDKFSYSLIPQSPSSFTRANFQKMMLSIANQSDLSMCNVTKYYILPELLNYRIGTLQLRKVFTNLYVIPFLKFQRKKCLSCRSNFFKHNFQYNV